MSIQGRSGYFISAHDRIVTKIVRLLHIDNEAAWATNPPYRDHLNCDEDCDWCLRVEPIEQFDIGGEG